MNDTSSQHGRRGHATLDVVSRNFKAIKIARLIGADVDQSPRRMLEIGTGSGGIAHYFGSAGVMGWEVEAVDVKDVRSVSEGYRFTCVADVMLPFADSSFDVVVSNHVIEHVGNAQQQSQHLTELARVLRPDGIGYIAVPSRWMLVEPHYRLPFLSWLPQRIADAYVRLTGKGSYYDCCPLTTSELESKLDNAGFTFVQLHSQALRMTYELEQPDSAIYRWLFKPVPDVLYAALRHVFPTLIYVFRPRNKAN
jgi:SAM-dependent methyltransferase